MSVNIKENDALNGIAKLIPASNITLSSLPDTNITLPQAEQSLGYDEASGRWINYNVRISVYYSDDFRGLNISCTKGQTTITKTAPMDGNAVVFYVNEKGTWTVSAEIGATSYTDTVVVTSFGVTYPAQLVTSSSQTPEGATVEPTDDIQIWLACANLDKPYTTLDAVLADRETFETLIADSNACDYMARSTTWAVNTVSAVPVMTDDTHPSGVASASSVYATGDYKAWRAFNGTNTDVYDCWASVNNATYPQYLDYEFEEPVCINRVEYYTRNYNESSSPKDVDLQAYDGSAWITLGSNTSTVATQNTKVGFSVNNYQKYSKYRFNIRSKNGSSPAYVCIGELSYFEPDITTDKNVMALIGKYDYCATALLGNSTWANAIANSDYFESVLNVKVPKMTSNTTPSGECISNVADSSSYYKYYAFDQNTSTAWAGAQSGNSYIGYKFTQQVVVDKAYFKTGNYYGRITSIKVQGSNDNFDSDIHDLSESITPTSDETTINLSSVGSYQYYRLYMSVNTAPIIYEVQFYGRASAQTNIIHSAPNDTIYYMEDGSPVVVCTTNSDGVGEFDLDDLEDATYTFYSSVAKDPSNLSNDFSKTIRITKSEFGGTTEMYLMPDTVKTLYWFGYESDDCEDCLASTGWSGTYTYVSPTHNTTSVTLATTTSQLCGIGTKNAINASSIKSICYKKNDSYSNTYIITNGTKTTGSSSNLYQVTNTSNALNVFTDTFTNQYVSLRSAVGATMYVSAFWYE